MIEALTTYDEHGTAAAHTTLPASRDGLAGNRPSHPWRQVLLLSIETLTRLNLQPTQLKENILLDSADNLHALPSGTIIRLGSIEIRLTFHCEPCRKVAHLASPRRLLHRRGYLGQILSAGAVSVGDSLELTGRHCEAIPYAGAERIRWFLQRQAEPITAAELVDAVGLSRGYCRALPRILRGHPDIDASKIIYTSIHRPPL